MPEEDQGFGMMGSEHLWHVAFDYFDIWVSSRCVLQFVGSGQKRYRQGIDTDLPRCVFRLDLPVSKIRARLGSEQYHEYLGQNVS